MPTDRQLPAKNRHPTDTYSFPRSGRSGIWEANARHLTGL